MPKAVFHSSEPFSREIMRCWLGNCFIQTGLWPHEKTSGGQTWNAWTIWRVKTHSVTETHYDLSLYTVAMPLRYATGDAFCSRRRACFMIWAQSHCHRSTLNKHEMLGNREVITTAILWVSNGCPQRQQDSLCESLESQHYCQLETTAP